MTTDGFTAPGFERVRDVFDANFAKGLEVGASFAAYHDGACVVDVWGGVAEAATGRPWERDAIVLVFSTTKGATAICAHKLVDDGMLDLDAPVAKYWPEFAQSGKTDVTVNHLLSHRAGLPYVDEQLSLEQALAWEPMIGALERQAPLWEPGVEHGYHAVTYGYLVGEVVRRASGKSIGAYFRDEIAAPLGLDFWIGLPEEQEPRVALLVGGLAPTGPDVDDDTRAMVNQLMGPDTMMGKALSVNGAFSGDGTFNLRAVRAAEVPAAAGVGDARSLARMYAACIGEVDGVRLLSEPRVRDATTQRTEGPDKVLMGLDLQWGLGFMVPSSILQPGGARGFGHFGAGGSGAFADPDAGLAFGYAMNKMAMGMAGDTRSADLFAACYEAIA